MHIILYPSNLLQNFTIIDSIVTLRCYEIILTSSVDSGISFSIVTKYEIRILNLKEIRDSYLPLRPLRLVRDQMFRLMPFFSESLWQWGTRSRSTPSFAALLPRHWDSDIDDKLSFSPKHSYESPSDTDSDEHWGDFDGPTNWKLRFELAWRKLGLKKQTRRSGLVSRSQRLSDFQKKLLPLVTSVWCWWREWFQLTILGRWGHSSLLAKKEKILCLNTWWRSSNFLLSWVEKLKNCYQPFWEKLWLSFTITSEFLWDDVECVQRKMLSLKLFIVVASHS